MALLTPKINQLILLKMAEEIAEVVERYVDSLFDWEGDFAVIAELVDNKVFTKALKPMKKKLEFAIRKAQRDAILSTMKKPRKLKSKGGIRLANKPKR